MPLVPLTRSDDLTSSYLGSRQVADAHDVIRTVRQRAALMVPAEKPHVPTPLEKIPDTSISAQAGDVPPTPPTPLERIDPASISAQPGNKPRPKPGAETAAAPVQRAPDAIDFYRWGADPAELDTPYPQGGLSPFRPQPNPMEPFGGYRHADAVRPQQSAPGAEPAPTPDARTIDPTLPEAGYVRPGASEEEVAGYAKYGLPTPKDKAEAERFGKVISQIEGQGFAAPDTEDHSRWDAAFAEAPDEKIAAFLPYRAQIAEHDPWMVPLLDREVQRRGLGGAGQGAQVASASSGGLMLPIAGGTLRPEDAQGSGGFGASRADHTHQGIDIAAKPGSAVVAPIAGKVRIGRPYSGDKRFQLVEITGEDGSVKLMYVKPSAGLENGATVEAGQQVGVLQDIGQKYAGITPHAHVEVRQGGKVVDPTPLFFPEKPGALPPGSPIMGPEGPQGEPLVASGQGATSLLGDASFDDLKTAVARAESAGDPNAISVKGAVGLMQVMPDTARQIASELGEADVAVMDDAQITEWLQQENPETGENNSERYGTYYLQQMLDRYDGNATLALAAYNAGPGRVDDWIEVYGDPRSGDITDEDFHAKIPISETRDYITKITGSLGERLALKARDVALDLWQGAKEAPRMAAGGVSYTLKETVQFLDSVGDWLDRNAGPGTHQEGGPLEFLANAAGALEDAAGDPKSRTGSAVKSMSGFLAAFLPAFSAARVAGLTRSVASIASGALASFIAIDPNEKRLSDAWKDAGLPENVLTEYLASDPSDTEIEGRFKNAIEGAGMGLIGEGILATARAIRSLRKTKVPQSAAEAQATTYGTVKSGTGNILGDPAAPPLGVRKVAAGEKATAGVDTDTLLKGADGPEEIFINFSRIESADSVKAVIRRMANRYARDIDEARRGVQSNEQTKKLADDLNMSVDDLLKRQKGQPFNAEQALAARRLLTASGEKLLEVAKAAADPNAGPLDQIAFRRMMAVHYAIQAEVIGARTETARALQAWAIPAGGGAEQARAIEQMVASMGGQGPTKELARRLAALSNAGASPEAVNAFVRKAWGAKTFDAVREAWVNALLSSPTTHIVNVTSNTLVAFQQIYERAAARGVNAIRGAEGVAPGEATAMAYGMVGGIKDAFRLSWKALRSGESGAALGKAEIPRPGSLSSEGFQISSETGLGQAVDFIGNAVRTPTRLIGAEDEFFKSVGYRMNLRAEALRSAYAEGARGRELARRVNQLLNDPPEHLRIAAADAALYQTFNSTPGAWGQALIRARESAPAVAFVMPFVRTPVNIARYAFERSPMAPLVKQWRADVAAGGARRDLALARMATGSTIMLATMDYADQGLVSGSGPDDPGEREALLRQGWQPYSIKVNGKWYSYNRADPFGMTMGFAADFAEMVRRREIEPDEVDEVNEVLAAGIAAVSQTVVNKTYMEGIANFVDMMEDPERYGADYVNQFIGSFVPAGVAAAERMVSPETSETSSIGDAALARIPEMSKALPVKRDLWGAPVKPNSGYGNVFDALTPVRVSKIKESPVDAEMQRLNLNQQRIGKKTDFGGVPVNLRDWPEVYDAYVRLAGNELKVEAWGDRGAKDFLDAVVSGQDDLSEVYNMGSDGEDGDKAMFIRKTIQEARARAREAILEDPQFAEFRAFIEERQREAEVTQRQQMESR